MHLIAADGFPAAVVNGGPVSLVPLGRSERLQEAAPDTGASEAGKTDARQLGQLEERGPRPRAAPRRRAVGRLGRVVRRLGLGGVVRRLVNRLGVHSIACFFS